MFDWLTSLVHLIAAFGSTYGSLVDERLRGVVNRFTKGVDCLAKGIVSVNEVDVQLGISLF